MRTRRRRARRIAKAIGLGLTAAAFATELRKPPGERTWHGRVAGLVPYDLRAPTPARFAAAWWSPQDPRVLVPTAFGVGWDVNVGRIAHLLARNL